MRILIVGAGGHGQVIADLLQQHPTFFPVGYADDNKTLHGKRLGDTPVLGSLHQIPKEIYDGVIVGIGNNTIRQKLFQKLKQQKIQTPSICHPTAICSPHATIGEGSILMAGAIVNTAAKIGKNVILNTGCIVEHHNQIGDHVHIAPGATFGGDVRILEGVFVGLGAKVLPQTTVGEWSIVGAGSVVTKNVSARTIVVGVPAKAIKKQAGAVSR